MVRIVRHCHVLCTSNEVDIRIWFGKERTIVELSLQHISCVMLESESIIWNYVYSYLPRSRFYIELDTTD